MSLIENLNSEWALCTRCPLCKDRKQVVPGRGSVSASYFIVGQNPGAKENETGKAFIGPSGVLLAEVLRECDIDVSDIYISNRVKCFTVGNRPPDRLEMDACYEYIKSEIQIIRPKVIILLGAVACSLIDSGIPVSISDSIQKTFVYDSVPAVVSPHPAAVLRDSKKWRGAMVSVFIRAREIVSV